MVDNMNINPETVYFISVKALIGSLDVDEQRALVALTWLGRGDFSPADWDAANTAAGERHTEHAADYLLGMPLLSDYLQEALSQLGVSCEDWDMEHL